MRTLSAILLLVSCGGPSRPDPVPQGDAVAIPLTANLAFAELSIPDDVRDGRPPPEAIPLTGGWRVARTGRRGTVYQTALPIRPRNLFFSRPPPGMQLLAADGTPIPHRADAGPTHLRWGFDATHLRLDVPDGAPPSPDLRLVYPKATEREAALNLAFSSVDDPASFVHTTVQAGPEARSGLLLPAPATAAWDLTIPPAGELRFSSALVDPEIRDDAPSDGARLLVEVVVDGATRTLRTLHLDAPTFDDHVVDLSRWAGQAVRLRLRTEPGATSRFDYAFVADPVVASRQEDPRRIVLVFIDTLRPDHLGVYGYGRETSPALDAFAQDAVVFDQARSVAPWTLPTARALLTGRHPEWYPQVPTLQGRFRDAGWATAMIAGNVFLSANFDLQRDWALHRVVNWPRASEQVDRALSWLESQEGRDALLLVHFMDAHLPYLEPRSHRYRFAGDPVGGLGEEFHRGDVLRAPTHEPAVRDYIVGRYDNNVRYIDDQLRRLLDGLDPDDVVVVFSDHGEEFWDHGGFEHGHTLYDEVLRVPLILRAPGARGRVQTPVSLLDLAPTLLDLAGIPYSGLDGRTLLPALRGAPLPEVDQAFGRPLYGASRWGVLHRGRKWTTHEGDDDLFDLTVDPRELRDLLPRDPDAGAPFPGYLGDALGTRVVPVLRAVAAPVRRSPRHDLTVTLTVPGGVDRAWVGEDPTRKSSAAVAVDGETVTITWHRGFRGTREVFLHPAGPFDEILPGIAGRIAWDDTEAPLDRVGGAGTPGRAPPPVLVGEVRRRRVQITRATAPLPFWDGEAIVGYDPELASMLQAMGYAVGDDE